ncbi:MAG TPA: hypothetical protein VK837_10225 [Longimicrobiales bacterium]|nr:hypothetical protein [Longimicrobiales bacterium]
MMQRIEHTPEMVPFHFDLSDHVRRSVATLYSHLVTRPTGQALRMGIESRIRESGGPCVSVLDFTEVVVLDFSCADETVAKLVRRYCEADPPAAAYFLARGVAPHHRETLDTVLIRQGMALVADVTGLGHRLLGYASRLEHRVWQAVEDAGSTTREEVATRVGDAAAGVAADTLIARRVVVPGSGARLHSLSRLTLAGG